MKPSEDLSKGVLCLISMPRASSRKKLVNPKKEQWPQSTLKCLKGSILSDCFLLSILFVSERE